MPPTVKDIAQQVGVSPSTVSRILNGESGHRMSAATRERVLEVAQRLGYQPNALARSLRGGRTGLIGFYNTWANDSFNAGHEFLAKIIGGLQVACGRQGYDLLLHAPMRGRAADEIYTALRNGRIDGLVLHGDVKDPLAQMLVDSGLPLVTIVDIIEGVPGVGVSEWDGVRQLVEYLWARDYRRFAAVAPLEGYGGPHQRRCDFQGMNYERGALDVPVFFMEFDTSAPPLDELLALQQEQPDEPLAVFCWNDRAAYSLLRACLARGVKVPQQLAVVGFDGFVDIKLPALQLVTVNCPWDEVAAKAVEILLGRINREDMPLNTRLPVDLVSGNTA